MFEVGDYIIYGSSGVCKITNVGPMKISGVSKDKLYYTMIPCYIRDSEIFTPIDNERVVMRRVMSKDEAEDFMSSVSDIDELEIIEEKKRELEYKQAVLTCKPEVLVGLLKTIQTRIDERTAEGKKVTSSDAKYFRIAEDNLFGELAISLDMEKDDVKEYFERFLQTEETKLSD
ncbi:MAG: CarD family transcriptional regulator [Eubacterium sp.]|nr:CarD family transcriptional regulator [Eubacterium sp.]